MKRFRPSPVPLAIFAALAGASASCGDVPGTEPVGLGGVSGSSGAGARAGAAGASAAGSAGTGGSSISGAGGKSAAAGAAGAAGTLPSGGGASGLAGQTAVGGSASGAAGASGRGGGSVGGQSGGAGFGGSAGAGGTGAGTAGAGGASAGMAGAGGNSSGGTSSAGSGGQGACTPPAPGSKGQNPLFTDQYTADPAPIVDGCTFYIACGHDEGPNGFVLREWFLLSSTDMVNWQKRVALRVSDFRWADANAWAGQIIEKGSKFYWFVPVNQRGSGMAIGVAVADSMAGPFVDAIGGPLIDDAYEMENWNFTEPGQTPFTIDPSVFVDDDGQAYLHYGGFGRLVVAKLNDDMISIDGDLREVTPQGFFEAGHLTKRNGKYYEIYAAGANPAAIDYATSNSPLGPWTRGGRILDPLPAAAGQDAATSHPGVAEFQGQWYFVYHLSNGPNGGGTYKRQVALEKLTFNTDGTIQKITPSAGLSF